MVPWLLASVLATDNPALTLPKVTLPAVEVRYTDGAVVAVP
jgi:hypothetical protein